ncbi:MAG TPA: DUF6304 family protein [Actinotalea sp.]|nr:DUF6304 family protein [Actinotalea sp.]
MEAIAFGGTYGDTDGSETINWLIRPSDRPGYEGRYEIVTMIRGIDIWGTDFDGLEPVDLDDPAAYERLHLNRANELAACVLTGDLPCGAEVDGRRLPGVVHFELSKYPAANQKGKTAKLKPGTQVRIIQAGIENAREESARGGPATYDHVEVLATKKKGYVLRAGDNFDPFF